MHSTAALAVKRRDEHLPRRFRNVTLHTEKGGSTYKNE
uniref:Uncharacterized protein n=1 Tax=Anguilla anguilla TaxID=7936 RepID=A0A0E9V695_ANGAN